MTTMTMSKAARCVNTLRPLTRSLDLTEEMAMQDPTQRCPRCTLALPLDAFPERHRGKQGNYCTPCARAYRAAYSAARRTAPRTCATQGCGTRVVGDRTVCAPCLRPATEPAVRTITTYTSAHRYLRKVRGKASAHACVDCAAPAHEWSYDHACPNELIGDNCNGRAVPFSLDLDRYAPRCRPCHYRADHSASQGDRL